MAVWARLKNADSIEVDGVRSLAAGAVPFPNGVKADTVSEVTPAAGVTIDGVLLKDGLISNSALGGEGTWNPGLVSADGASITSSTINSAFYNFVGSQTFFAFWYSFNLAAGANPTALNFNLPFAARPAQGSPGGVGSVLRFPSYASQAGAGDATFLSYTETNIKCVAIKVPGVPWLAGTAGSSLIVNGVYLKV